MLAPTPHIADPLTATKTKLIMNTEMYEQEEEKPKRRRVLINRESKFHKTEDELVNSIHRKQFKTKMLDELIIHISSRLDIFEVRSLSKKLIDLSTEIVTLGNLIYNSNSDINIYKERIYKIEIEACEILNQLIDELEKADMFTILNFMIEGDYLKEIHFDHEHLYESERNVLKVFDYRTDEGSAIFHIFQQIQEKGRTNLLELARAFCKEDKTFIQSFYQNTSNYESKEDVKQKMEKKNPPCENL